MNRHFRFYLILPLLFSLHFMFAQTPERPLSVGIFIYEGVEILDFTGPAEVFGSTEGFKTFTVAVSNKPLLSQGFITVTPQYSIADCPPTDILVFPGGNSGPLVENPELIEWVKKRSQNTQFMMSVCTGASVLSKAGLLDGLEVTTWYGFIPELRRMNPRTKVLEKTRFVDNGHVVTTAGVSAGIDGALHLVSRIRGEDVARGTARYMEYDKWNAREGKVFETPFVATLRAQGLEAAQRLHPAQPGALQPPFYTGELLNLAEENLASRPEFSNDLYRYLFSIATPTPALYDALGNAWRRTGKPAPPDSKTFMEKLEAGGNLDWAKKTYTETLKEQGKWQFFTETGVNDLAYRVYLSDKTRIAEAIAILQWNAELFPASPNVWDSLSELHEAAGAREEAIAASSKCLDLLPHTRLDEPTKALYSKISQERIARLKSKP